MKITNMKTKSMKISNFVQFWLVLKRTIMSDFKDPF